MEITIKKIEDFEFISQNIKSILNNTFGQILNELNDIQCNYYISGGYALALLIAPRTANVGCYPFDPDASPSLDSMVINEEYYEDIDLFFEKEIDFWKAKSILEKYSRGFSSIYESDNQATYRVNNKKIQIIKHAFGTPAEIMENFDFINCSIFFDKQLNVYTHVDFYKTILQKELRMNVFRFDQIEDLEEFKYYAEMISTRVKKYCQRYSWHCSSKLKNYLQAVINFYPDLKHTKSRIVGSGSSSYMTTRDENIWNKLKSIGLEIPQ